MAWGGHRAGAGRKRKRPIDQEMAARILARVKVEELLIELIGKARKSKTTHELREILKYLIDRRDGKAVQPLDTQLSNKDSRPLQIVFPGKPPQWSQAGSRLEAGATKAKK